MATTKPKSLLQCKLEQANVSSHCCIWHNTFGDSEAVKLRLLGSEGVHKGGGEQKQTCTQINLRRLHKSITFPQNCLLACIPQKQMVALSEKLECKSERRRFWHPPDRDQPNWQQAGQVMSNSTQLCSATMRVWSTLTKLAAKYKEDWARTTTEQNKK